MQLADVLTSDRLSVVTMPTDAPLTAAITVMSQQNSSVVMVVDGDKLKGILTRSDVLRYFAQTSKGQITSVALGQAMTKKLLIAAPQETSHQALERMAAAGIERIPIVRDGRLISVLHRSDLLLHQLRLLQSDIVHLQDYIETLHNAEQD